MKKLALLVICLLSIQIATAQIKVYVPGTGDKELDKILSDVNENAKDNLEFFAKDVGQKFNIAKSLVDKVIKTMHPGDIFMAAQLSSILNKPFEDILGSYDKNKGKGWGVIAKELGIKPGSPEFHKMKKMMKSNGNSKGNGNSGSKDNGNSGNKGNGNGNGKGKNK